MSVDIRGQKFGRLTALEPTEARKNGCVVWKCQCDCGNLFEVDAHRLRNGTAKSCGCLKSPNRVGERFGSLVVVGRSDRRASRGERMVPLWECRCDCGATVYRAMDRLTRQKDCACPACAAKKRTEKMRANAGFVNGTQMSKIQNSDKPASNASGIRGVYLDKRTGRWLAKLSYQGKSHFLGSFGTIEEAAEARRNAEKQFFEDAQDAQTLPAAVETTETPITETLVDEQDIAHASEDIASEELQPVAAESVLRVEEAEVSEESAVVEEPAVDDAPAVAEVSEVADEPIVTEEPAVTEETPGFDESVAVAEPVNVEEPAAADIPVVSEESAVPEAPEVVEEPIAAEPPVIPEEPKNAEAPAVMEEPMVAEAASVEEAAAVEEPTDFEDFNSWLESESEDDIVLPPVTEEPYEYALYTAPVAVETKPVDEWTEKRSVRSNRLRRRGGRVALTALAGIVAIILLGVLIAVPKMNADPAADTLLTIAFDGNAVTSTAGAGSTEVTLTKSSIVAAADHAYGYEEALPSAYREGYEFAGWFTAAVGGTEITADSLVSSDGDHTLYAHWIPKQYTVTFDISADMNAVGGADATVMPADTLTVTFDEPYNSAGNWPIATRVGYFLDGWYTSDGTEVEAADLYQRAGNQILYAKWTAREYTVSFRPDAEASPDDGAVSITPASAIKVSYDQTYDIGGVWPEARREGYDFLGWYTSDGDIVRCSDVYRLAKDQTLYARWLPVVKESDTDRGYNKQSLEVQKSPELAVVPQYIVSFDPDGGSVGLKSKLVSYASAYGELPIPTKSEIRYRLASLSGIALDENEDDYLIEYLYQYIFGGWYLDNAKVTDATKVLARYNHTLKAAWIDDDDTEPPEALDIRFEINDDPETALSKIVYRNSIYGSLPTPEWEGHTFTGWFTSRDGGEQITSATIVLEDVVNLYAHWVEDNHTDSDTLELGEDSGETASPVVDPDEAEASEPAQDTIDDNDNEDMEIAPSDPTETLGEDDAIADINAEQEQEQESEPEDIQAKDDADDCDYIEPVSTDGGNNDIEAYDAGCDLGNSEVSAAENIVETVETFDEGM